MGTEVLTTAYRKAAEYLIAQGFPPAPLMPEVQLLWQRGGIDRRLAQSIVQSWETAA